MARVGLDGRVIAITGASSGIGAATAVACAEAGMCVVAAARRQWKLDELVERIATCGYAVAVRCDVRDRESVASVMEAAQAHFGRLDAVFANAGYGLFGSVLDTPEQDVRAMFETNYFGTLHTVRAALPLMRQTMAEDRARRVRAAGGHVVICSSAGSEIPLPMFGHYAATKAAQDSIGGALRAELDAAGIMVSTLHPIGTRTGFFETMFERSGGGGFNTPDALMQSPERVARAVVRGLRRRQPEMWPSRSTRFALALTTAFPHLSAWVNRRMMARVSGPEERESTLQENIGR